METSRDGAMDDFRMDWAAIRNRILQAGEKAGLKDQTAIARAAGGTLKQQEISALGEIKNGKQCTITAEKLARIAHVCGVSLDWLVFGDQGNKPEHDETWDTLRPYGESILHMITGLHANLSTVRYKMGALGNVYEEQHKFINLLMSRYVPLNIDMFYLSIEIPLFPTFQINNDGADCNKKIREEWNKKLYSYVGANLGGFSQDIAHAFQSTYIDIRNREIQAALNKYGDFVLPQNMPL